MQRLSTTGDADVLIAGAGPCGTFLAHLLGQAGLSCLLFEKRTEIPAASMAIGIMPPTLRRLHHVNLADPVLRAGCVVRAARIMDAHAQLGYLSLEALPPPFPFVLSLPQSALLHILRDLLALYPNVRTFTGQEAVTVRSTDAGVVMETRATENGATSQWTGRFAVACDGHRSTIRTGWGLGGAGKSYAPSFIMGDFPDHTGWPAEARLYFTPDGAIESFPLPQTRRRWVVQAPPMALTIETLVQRVANIAGVKLDADAAAWPSVFTPRRYVCQRFYQGRVVLCGDAAHVMSPTGGQGMNTGLADAWHLSTLLKDLCATGRSPEPLFAAYQQVRREAFRVAARRAAQGLWLGAHTGPWFSSLRSFFIRRILFEKHIRRTLAPHFAMLTIPDKSPQSLTESQTCATTF